MNTGFVRQILIITLFRLLLNTGRRFIYPFAPALSRGLDVPLAAVTSIIAAGQFSSLLGIGLIGLADRDLELLDCAARVLDLGRVEIPDDVLTKAIEILEDKND